MEIFKYVAIINRMEKSDVISMEIFNRGHGMLENQQNKMKPTNIFLEIQQCRQTHNASAACRQPSSETWRVRRLRAVRLHGARLLSTHADTVTSTGKPHLHTLVHSEPSVVSEKSH